MGKPQLEILFERYREQGDLRALARVFDLTARDLARLARRLACDPGEVEDLVQATFTAAIERASSFRRGRALKPWLAGILAIEAAALRRRKQRDRRERDVQAEDLVPRTLEEPAAQALAAQATSQVERVILRLPALDREVLRPYLQAGDRPEDIARALDLAPGTVRMRIHRGLDRLRALLPMGLSAALGGALFAPVWLPRVRTRILRHAALSLGEVAVPVGSGAALTLGGLRMGKNVIVAGVLGSLALVLGLCWEALPGQSGPSLEREQGAIGEEEHVAVTTDLRSLELDAATFTSDAPLASAGLDARIVQRDGRVIVRGRLQGVHPQDLADVQLQLTPYSELQNQITTGRLDNPLGRVRVSNQPRGAVDLFLTETIDVSGHAAPQILRTTIPLPAVSPAQLDAQGNFSFDVSNLYEDEGQNIFKFTLGASHPLYFPGSAEVAVPAGTAALYRAKNQVALDLPTTVMMPAAILSGEVQELAQEALLVSGLQATKLINFSEEISDVGYTITISPQIQSASGQVILADDGLLLTRSFVVWASINTLVQNRVALFRFDGDGLDPKPVATTNWDGDNTFELKVDQGGSYVVLIFDADHRPVTRFVELKLRAREQLDLVELDHGERIAGLAAGRSVVGAGMSVRARRRLGAKDQSIEIDGHKLIWTGTSIEWAERTSETGDDGSFEIDGLSHSIYEVGFAEKGDLSAGQSEHEEIESWAPSEGLLIPVQVAVVDLELLLPEASGRQDEEDDWSVEVSLLDAAGQTRASAIIRGDTTLRLLLGPDADYRLQVKGAGLETRDEPIHAPAAGELLERTIRLDRE